MFPSPISSCRAVQGNQHGRTGAHEGKLTTTQLSIYLGPGAAEVQQVLADGRQADTRTLPTDAPSVAGLRLSGHSTEASPRRSLCSRRELPRLPGAETVPTRCAPFHGTSAETAPRTRTDQTRHNICQVLRGDGRYRRLRYSALWKRKTRKPYRPCLGWLTKAFAVFTRFFGRTQEKMHPKLTLIFWYRVTKKL